ncbi:bifunctional NAD(P)H-hydrate repair enzyme Nnr [Clostridia bacterium]|nr:bifunctional NAD(P)H-hydrate repair enzyme Nnr [Clostridia bacterium]
MKVLNCKQTRQLELAQVSRGSSYYDLMENAGVQAGKVLIGKLGAHQGQEVAVLCGKGNNGGDGFVAAKYLKTQGLNPVIILTDGEPKTHDAARAFDNAAEQRIPVWRLWESRKKVYDIISGSDFVIDAVYGIGFTGALPEGIKELVYLVNNHSCKVLSIDLPSGIECDLGSIENGAFEADVTVTFSTLKAAHVLYPAMDFCGDVTVVQVGIHKTLISKSEFVTETIEEEFIVDTLPKQNKSANKGSAGALLTVCGSAGMAGAAVLCNTAALRSGIGLLKAAIPKSVYPIVAPSIPQAICLPTWETVDGKLALNSAPVLLEEADKVQALVIGCGLGTGKETEDLVCEIVKNAEIPIVIDADGINAIAKHIDVLKETNAEIIITPHPGEMARLARCKTDEVQNNRLIIAQWFAQKYKVTLVLKGANTIVVAKDGTTLINTTGNTGMAKGGSGDVLSGIIGSFLAMGAKPYKAAAAAVYCHGAAGDQAAREHGKLFMQPTDLINELQFVYKKLFEN